MLQMEGESPDEWTACSASSRLFPLRVFFHHAPPGFSLRLPRHGFPQPQAALRGSAGDVRRGVPGVQAQTEPAGTMNTIVVSAAAPCEGRPLFRSSMQNIGFNAKWN
jgi:hypothetical protein